MIDRTPFDPERTRISTEGGYPHPEPVERAAYVQTFTEALTRRPDWHTQAACRGAGPDLFFPDTRQSDEAVDTVRSYCNGCPVRLECLEAGLSQSDRDDFGVWGGVGRKERRDMRRRAKRGPNGDPTAPFYALVEMIDNAS